MTTWQLWRALKFPLADHPTYRRVTDDSYDESIRWNWMLQNLLTEGQLWIWPLLFMIDMRAITFVILGGSIYGLIWATTISNRIRGEQNKHTYELLCLTPDGVFGAVWAIITGSLHRGRIFEFVNSIEAWGIRFLLFVPFIISSLLLLERLFNFNNHLSVFWIVAFVALYCLDHMQSIVLGCLWGVISAHLSSNIDKRVAALIGFVGLQVITYLVVVLVCGLGFPIVQSNLESEGWVADTVYPLFTIAVFYLTREFAIRRLWQWLISCLSLTAPSEELLLQLKRWQKVANHHYDDTQVVARA